MEPLLLRRQLSTAASSFEAGEMRSPLDEEFMVSLKLSEDDLLSSLTTDVGSQAWLLLKYPDPMELMGHEQLRLLESRIRQIGDEFIISEEYWCPDWHRCYHVFVKPNSENAVARGGDISYFDVGHCRPAWFLLEKGASCVWEYLTGPSMSVLSRCAERPAEGPEGTGCDSLVLCPRWETVHESTRGEDEESESGGLLCTQKELEQLFTFLNRKRCVNWHECLAQLELYLSLNVPSKYQKASRYFECLEGEYLRRG